MERVRRMALGWFFLYRVSPVGFMRGAGYVSNRVFTGLMSPTTSPHGATNADEISTIDLFAARKDQKEDPDNDECT